MELDPVLLEDLGVAQRFCLAIVVVIAAVVLTAWFVPALAHALPAAWSLMKVNTALLALCSALSLLCSQPRRSKSMVMASQLIAVFIGLVGLAVLLEYATGTSLHVDTLLPINPLSAPPGRMSPQSAFCFALLSVVLFLLRHRKRLGSIVGDVFLSALSVMVLVIASGYLYGALRLFGLSGDNRTAPQTLVCLLLLNFVAFGRRAEYGVFGILLGTGIGSRIARVACPIVFFLPFMLEAARGVVVQVGLLHPDYATAVATALAVLLAFGLILTLAWRIDSLERDIRDLSLRDELTKLYNRRGFYLLAEQALRLAQRSRTPFSVLFIDLDNLKQINDTQGHEMGSQFLCEVSTLLENFVRRSDVVGRVGGDEFVIAGQSSETAMRSMAQRLEEAVEARNSQPNREYPFSFSLGLATSGEEENESLEDLLHRADNAMYANKREKKQLKG
jgi:diguanylate cyclase (GGDEF)-like protein